MSVLIKGMEMPMGCYECPFEVWGKCMFIHYNAGGAELSKNCPLVEVPTPHRRLMDDVVEVVRCKDCRWGRDVCGNIECFVDSNAPTEYHGYEWFCPNGERREEAEHEHTD